MAKVSKLFRLSEEAVAILDSKPNATLFVEELILKQTETISRGEALIIDKLDKMELRGLNAYQQAALTGQALHIPSTDTGLSSKGRTEAFEASNLGSSPSEPANIKLNSDGTVSPKDPTKPSSFTTQPALTRNEITSEIARLEAERDEKLEYSQDAVENKRVGLVYKAKIDWLWTQFHALGKDVR